MQEVTGSGFSMKKWAKAWGSKSGKSFESLLHLDDIHDVPKDNVHENATNGMDRECCSCHDEYEPEAAARTSKLASVESSSVSLNIQGHIARLHDYGDLCERANYHAASTNNVPPSCPYGWTRHANECDTTSFFAESGTPQTDSKPPTPHGSFLVARTTPPQSPRRALSSRAGSPQSSPPHIPQRNLCSREGGIRQRPQSCLDCPTLSPTLEAMATLPPSRDGGSGRRSGGSPSDSDVYRRQVALALNEGRTVWL
jgi:hypothetical protein